MIKCILGPLLALMLALPLVAQSDEEVLFTIDDEPVTVGEFRYIYGKTSGERADYGRASVMEYLDLYQRFKLKVARAREMGLDTVVALKNELEGYRKQLADNYLVDREVTEGLVEDLYRRKQTDVDFSHLLIKIDDRDTLAAYRRALELRERLTPDNFASLATTQSEDTYSKERGGRIGFIAAPLPRGLFRLEEALYGTENGEVAGPVRSSAGYHLFLRHGERAARGEVEIAHILIRKEEGGGDAGAKNARGKAEAALAALAAGEDFGSVAAEYSEDSKSKSQEGYIGFFGINRYNKSFEDAAFALENDGDLSGVVESPAGFHILRRISRRGVQPLEEQRPLLEAAVKQDERFTEGRRAMIERLKERYGATAMEGNLDTYASAQDSSFFEVRRPFPPRQRPEPLLTIGERSLTVADFERYLGTNARLRASLVRKYSPEGAVHDLYERWEQEQVEAYAEAQLERQFPEFRALMREYREGILLFEATKLEVWDKAGEDTSGLQAFYAAHRDDYAFDERAVVETYTLPATLGLTAEELVAMATASSADTLSDRYGSAGLTVSADRYEADRLPEGLEMKAGSHRVEEEGATTTVRLVRGIEPARPKELDEARGYVIADYQDQLEREWVERLRQEHSLKVNEKVLNQLIEP